MRVITDMIQVKPNLSDAAGSDSVASALCDLVRALFQQDSSYRLTMPATAGQFFEYGSIQAVSR